MLQVGSRMTASMETSFYADDAMSPFLSASRRGGGGGGGGDMTSANHERIRSLKKSMTLDLAAGSTTASSTTSSTTSSTMKRPIFGLLSSPDLNLLKLASPELEKLIIAQNNGQVTTTPTPGGGGSAGSHQFIFAKTVTEEQEMYARGFVDALAELHHGGTSSSMDDEEDDDGGDSMMEASSGSESGGSAISGAPTAFSAFGVNGDHAPFQLAPGPPAVLAIKEEPQIVPSESPPPQSSSSTTSASVHPIGMSPIDMLAQERIKLERKRQRNRVAASKCRKRKLERIARLEDKVKLLKDENGELGTVVTKLKDHICGLKQQLMDHVNSGCQIMTPSQYLS